MSVEKTPDKAIRCQPVLAVAHDKNGPLFDNKHVVDQCHDYIENENYFKRRCKNMERDYEKSADVEHAPRNWGIFKEDKFYFDTGLYSQKQGHTAN